MTRSFMIFS